MAGGTAICFQEPPNRFGGKFLGLNICTIHTHFVQLSPWPARPNFRTATQQMTVADMINTIDNGIDIDFFNTIGIGIDIDKAIFKLLVLILILIRRFLNYWY